MHSRCLALCAVLCAAASSAAAASKTFSNATCAISAPPDWRQSGDEIVRPDKAAWAFLRSSAGAPLAIQLELDAGGTIVLDTSTVAVIKRPRTQMLETRYFAITKTGALCTAEVTVRFNLFHILDGDEGARSIASTLRPAI